MKKTREMKIGLVVTALMVFFFSCTKNATQDNGPYQLSYGDSILFLKPAPGDYIVSPVTHRQGTYSGFPEGIEIDEKSGEINISKSETGLRYKITHTATDGTITTTKVVLSGITYTDHYYHLSAGDTIASPVYNASISRILPVNGSSFDDGNLANGGGCSVTTTNGQINLAETVRNGVFGSTPQNDVRKDFDIFYRLNDESGKSVNKLRVRLYYYNTMADVPQDLLQTLQDRSDLGVFLRGSSTTSPTSASRISKEAKPRPPCVIVIGQ